MNFLCISCDFKGGDFLKACKEAGNNVFLLTKESLKDEAWPNDYIDETFYTHTDANTPEHFGNLIKGMSFLMKTKKIDRIVALDDFDVEKAAMLREEFRLPGMGQTTARHFRDKLAMRMKAKEAGINCPPFSHLFTDEAINQFIAETPTPWVVKPRGEASAAGIKKVHSGDELWQVVHSLGENRHEYLVEQFKPGAVYHADAISVDGKVAFCRGSQYLSTPMEVAHGGGIFRSVIVPFGSEDDKEIQKETKKVMKAFGMKFSASHTEFIKSHEDGKFYFLETASRVGGAHLAEMVEASSGINLWQEWSKLETAMAQEQSYTVPKPRKDYAGIIVSLSRFQHPDMSVFNDEEVVWKIEKDYHVGIIVRSKKRERVLELLDKYAEIVARDFHAQM